MIQEIIDRLRKEDSCSQTADGLFLIGQNTYKMYQEFYPAFNVDDPGCIYDELEEILGNEYHPVPCYSEDYDEAEEIYKGTDRVDLSKEERRLGLFDTPEPIALAMRDLGDIRPGDLVMDPSAGRGRLLKYALQKNSTHHHFTENPVRTIGFELAGRQSLSMTGEREVTIEDGLGIIHGNFMELEPPERPDVILMNPPFGKAVKELGEESGERAVIHFYRAFKMLKEGGRIVALFPSGVFRNNNKQLDQFRKKLASREYMIRLNLGHKMFKETPIPTVLIVVDKVPQSMRAMYGVVPTADVESIDEIYHFVSHCQHRKI